MKYLLLLSLLSGCATKRSACLPDILMQHNQGGYFTAKEYLERRDK